MPGMSGDALRIALLSGTLQERARRGRENTRAAMQVLGEMTRASSAEKMQKRALEARGEERAEDQARADEAAGAQAEQAAGVATQEQKQRVEGIATREAVIQGLKTNRGDFHKRAQGVWAALSAEQRDEYSRRMKGLRDLETTGAWHPDEMRRAAGLIQRGIEDILDSPEAIEAKRPWKPEEAIGKEWKDERGNEYGRDHNGKKYKIDDLEEKQEKAAKHNLDVIRHHEKYITDRMPDSLFPGDPEYDKTIKALEKEAAARYGAALLPIPGTKAMPPPGAPPPQERPRANISKWPPADQKKLQGDIRAVISDYVKAAKSGDVGKTKQLFEEIVVMRQSLTEEPPRPNGMLEGLDRVIEQHKEVAGMHWGGGAGGGDLAEGGLAAPAPPAPAEKPTPERKAYAVAKATEAVSSVVSKLPPEARSVFDRLVEAADKAKGPAKRAAIQRLKAFLEQAGVEPAAAAEPAPELQARQNFGGAVDMGRVM